MFITATEPNFLDNEDLVVLLRGPNGGGPQHGGTPTGVTLTIPAANVAEFCDALEKLPLEEQPADDALVTGSRGRGVGVVRIRSKPIELQFVILDDARKFLVQRVRQLRQALVA